MIGPGLGRPGRGAAASVRQVADGSGGPAGPRLPWTRLGIDRRLMGRQTWCTSDRQRGRRACPVTGGAWRGRSGPGGTRLERATRSRRQVPRRARLRPRGGKIGVTRLGGLGPQKPALALRRLTETGGTGRRSAVGAGDSWRAILGPDPFRCGRSGRPLLPGQCLTLQGCLGGGPDAARGSALWTRGGGGRMQRAAQHGRDAVHRHVGQHALCRPCP